MVIENDSVNRMQFHCNRSKHIMILVILRAIIVVGFRLGSQVRTDGYRYCVASSCCCCRSIQFLDPLAIGVLRTFLYQLFILA